MTNGRTKSSNNAVEIDLESAVETILANNEINVDGDINSKIHRLFHDPDLTMDLVHNLIFVIQNLNQELCDQEQRLSDLNDMLRYHFGNSKT